MNAVVTQPPARRLITPEEIEPRLRAALDAFNRGSAVPGTIRANQATAQRRMDALQDALMPGEKLAMVAWLELLSRMVRGAPEDDKLIARHGNDTWTLCHALPRVCWAASTVVQWVQHGPRGAHWPVPAEIYRLLAPIADRYRGERESCRRLLAWSPEPEPYVASPEERDSVRRQMAAHRARMGWPALQFDAAGIPIVPAVRDGGTNDE